MAPPKSRKRKSDAEKSEKRQKLPVRIRDEDTSVLAAPVINTLKVFGDEDDAEPIVVKKQVTAKPKQQDEELSDDDAAPEVVSAVKSVLEIKTSAAALQKAASEKLAAEKRKRRDKDTIFKKQADARKKASKKTTKPANSQSDEDASEDASEAEAAIELQSKPRWKKHMDRISLPSTLPAEYLTDSSSDEEDEDVDMDIDSRPKRRRVADAESRLTRLDKGPQDERVGSTVYRVSTNTDQRLAPKAKKHTRSGKEVMRRRDRTPVKSGGGFFVKN